MAKSIRESLADYREDFELFDDPRDKFVQLMDIGKLAPDFDPGNRTDENRVIGCASPAWLTWKQDPVGKYWFQADSGSAIVKGLLTLLTNIFNGHTGEEIAALSGVEILTALGLEGAITSQRTNGFMSAIAKIQSEIIQR